MGQTNCVSDLFVFRGSGNRHFLESGIGNWRFVVIGIPETITLGFGN